MKLVTFNNLIPSHSMKFILWQDVDDSADEEAQDEDHSEYEDDEDEDVAEVEGLVST